MITASRVAASLLVKRRPAKAPQQVLSLVRVQVGAVAPGELEKQLRPWMNRVIVYRALQVLLEVGLIGRLTDGEHVGRYYVRVGRGAVVQFCCELYHQLIVFAESAIACRRRYQVFNLIQNKHL